MAPSRDFGVRAAQLVSCRLVERVQE